MGLFGSMLDASRLLISYEHSDMALAWQDPGADDAPTGVVVVDAERTTLPLLTLACAVINVRRLSRTGSETSS